VRGARLVPRAGLCRVGPRAAAQVRISGQVDAEIANDRDFLTRRFTKVV
jgi:hypothetical protein